MLNHASKLMLLVEPDAKVIFFLANKGIEAGKHYIIKPSSDKEKKTAGEYKFKRVQGNETLPANLPDQTLNRA